MTTLINAGNLRRSKIALIMVLCGLAGAASVGVASAGTDDSAPSVAVKFDPQMLATEDGARAVYQRIVQAAALACPGVTTGSHLLSTGAQKCRDQAVANMVRQINNPRLAQVYNASMKHS